METKYGQWGELIPHELFEIDTENLIEGDIFENEDGIEIKYYKEGFKLFTNYPSNYLNISEIKSNWKLCTIPSPQKELMIKYEYKGNHYQILGHCAFKNPETRKWVDAVYYKNIDGNEIWVREIEEFFKLFKLVE